MEQAIRKAIEGGYNPNWNIHKIQEFPELYDKALLDPLFWQALGKAEWWNNIKAIDLARCEICDSKTCHKKIVKGEPKNYVPTKSWLYHWHHFIDHLAEGKDAESFFTDLLKANQ